MLNRKEQVLNILNESYKEDDSSFKPKESSYVAGGDEDLMNLEESPKVLKQKKVLKKSFIN